MLTGLWRSYRMTEPGQSCGGSVMSCGRLRWFWHGQQCNSDGCWVSFCCELVVIGVRDGEETKCRATNAHQLGSRKLGQNILL